MGKCDGKLKQSYVYHPSYWWEITCIIHGLGHSSDEYTVLSVFGTNYVKGGPFKGRRQDPTSNNVF